MTSKKIEELLQQGEGIEVEYHRQQSRQTFYICKFSVCEYAA
jgi:hypothetical protein